VMDFYQIIKKPLITEKATKQKEQANQLTFEVDRRANKILVRNAVENIFKVKVLSVTVTNVKGKKQECREKTRLEKGNCKTCTR